LAREGEPSTVDVDGRAHAIRFDGSCATCGGFHIPDAAMLARPDFDWRQALAAVLAVGLRPCTGAIVVLVFALSQGLLGAGVLSAYAMALGTAITVAILAILAVGARDLVSSYAGGAGTRRGRMLLRAAEILGAFAVLGFGVTLLVATLVGGGVIGG
jgi:ABC-type nickel/cobalt efflux system permease component RcnA